MARLDRKALTVVEVLVVISIIGMLIALALPADQATRESDFKKPQYWEADPAKLSVGQEMIEVFLCPSDPGEFGNSYRACLGPGPYSVGSHLSPGGDKGPFTVLAQYRPGDYRDGLSNTIAMSEKIRSDINPDWYSPEDFWYSGVDELSTSLTADEMVTVCSSLSGQPAEFFGRAGHTWFLAGYDHTWYNHAATPNAPVPDCSTHVRTEGISSDRGVFTASSFHFGGVNCVFMDGRTRYISNDIDLAVWRALSTRAGHESLDDRDY